MKIAFYAGQCLPIHAYSLEERPLGGTESGVIQVAEILSKRGHDVTVFTSHRAPPESTPRYLFHEQLLGAGEFDALIVVQFCRPLIPQLQVKRLFYWSGDAPDQYANFGIGDKRMAQKIERFFAVSNWQARALCEHSGFPYEKTSVVGNGVNLSLFRSPEKRVRKRLIYSSAPYRGLALAPPLIEKLKAAHADLEFHVFAGLNIYDTVKPFQGPEVAQYDKFRKALEKIPGCVVHGNTVQRVLARQFMKSSLLFYPNIFPETSCITAMEAQAAGCPVVTSAFAALPETVADAGILIHGEPGSPEYMEKFFQAANVLLSDDVLWRQLSENGLRRAKSMSWEGVVDRFESCLHL